MSFILKCVNPLSIGTPISTPPRRIYVIYIKMCQSPIYRDTHFYLFLVPNVIFFIATCQSPIYRDTHFYGTKWIKQPYKTDIVSIPYLSGHPFLRNNIRGNYHDSIFVSIPYLSGHPFLQDTMIFLIVLAVCVNPLSIGTPISTEQFRR